MDLLNSILNANGGASARQLAQQFGLREDQATAAISSLVPALAGGLQRNISQGGLDTLLSALSGGNHQQYLDDPSTLATDRVRDEGNGILGHVLGSKDVSRQVAAQAAAQTGIGESILKQMLPAVAAMSMGALSRQSSSPQGGSGLLGMLTPMLDRNRDGSVTDDLLGSVSRLFKK